MTPALEIERVEWLSSSTEAVVVRVFGRWRENAVRAESFVLLVDDGSERQPFVSLDLPPLVAEGDPGLWSVAFSVPIELRPRLEHGLALELDGQELALPPALAGGTAPPAAAQPAQVIDRGVLAERRARRAELNEQVLTRRLGDAEARVTTLESQLANLETRLEQAAAERERMAAEVHEQEREVRRVKQREYAEQQLRFEAEERRRRAEEHARAEHHQLRARLAQAETEVRRLAEQQEHVRRELAEAQHALAADQARLERARRELADREASLTQRERTLAEGERATAGQLDAAEGELARLRAELQAREVELEEQVHQLEARAGELEAELQAERDRRGAAERQLQGAAAESESIATTEADARERARIAGEVQAELAVLREELDQARESAREHAQRGLAAERLLEELGGTLADLRAQVDERAGTDAGLQGEAEARAAALAEAERTITELHSQVSELEATLAREREQHADELAALRVELDRLRASGAPAADEQARDEELRGLRAELQAARADAQARRAHEDDLERMLAELTATASELRASFDRELGALQTELEAHVLQEREGYVRELAAMEQRVELLRRELGETAAALHAELQDAQVARARIEAELHAERARGQAERAAHRDLETELQVERVARRSLEAALAAERARSAAAGTTGAPTAPVPGISTPVPPPPVPAPTPAPVGDQIRAEVHALERELLDLRERAQAAGLAMSASPAGSPAAPPAGSLPGAPVGAGPAQPPAAAVAPAPQPLPEPGPPPAGPPLAGAPPPAPQEMAAALAEAIARLRARIPGATEPAGAPEPAAASPGAVSDPSAGVLRPTGPRPGEEPTTPPSWLARATRALAGGADPRLAGDLVAELLPVQGLRVARRVTYVLEIEGGERYRVAAEPGRPATVGPVTAGEGEPTFTLSGSASALAELAAGGAGRRLPGVRVSGRRWQLRRLLRAMREPVRLAELAAAEIRVWPGLVLGALAREIEPGWTVGHRFAITFAIEGVPGATLYAEVRSGEALRIGQEPPATPSRVTVYANESALLSLLAGFFGGPEEPARMSGDEDALAAFLAWVDRVQGRARA